MWFNNWRDTLEEKGFGRMITRPATFDELMSMETGDARDTVKEFTVEEFIIPDEQLRRIVNIDESCLSLDGASQTRGGRPAVAFHSAGRHRGAKRASKSSITVTFIGGSSAAGEPVPPHFQFGAKAQSDEMTIEIDVLRHLEDV